MFGRKRLKKRVDDLVSVVDSNQSTIESLQEQMQRLKTEYEDLRAGFDGRDIYKKLKSSGYDITVVKMDNENQFRWENAIAIQLKNGDVLGIISRIQGLSQVTIGKVYTQYAFFVNSNLKSIPTDIFKLSDEKNGQILLEYIYSKYFKGGLKPCSIEEKDWKQWNVIS